MHCVFEGFDRYQWELMITFYDRKTTDRMHDQIENAYCATVPPLEKGRKVASSVKKVAIKGDELMLRTHLRCKMSTEANARCFSSLTGHTCAALVACNAM